MRALLVLCFVGLAHFAAAQNDFNMGLFSNSGSGSTGGGGTNSLNPSPSTGGSGLNPTGLGGGANNNLNSLASNPNQPMPNTFNNPGQNGFNNQNNGMNGQGMGMNPNGQQGFSGMNNGGFSGPQGGMGQQGFGMNRGPGMNQGFSGMNRMGQNPGMQFQDPTRMGQMAGFNGNNFNRMGFDPNTQQNLFQQQPMSNFQQGGFGQRQSRFPQSPFMQGPRQVSPFGGPSPFGPQFASRFPGQPTPFGAFQDPFMNAFAPPNMFDPRARPPMFFGPPMLEPVGPVFDGTGRIVSSGELGGGNVFSRTGRSLLRGNSRGLTPQQNSMNSFAIPQGQQLNQFGQSGSFNGMSSNGLGMQGQRSQIGEGREGPFASPFPFQSPQGGPFASPFPFQMPQGVPGPMFAPFPGFPPTSKK